MTSIPPGWYPNPEDATQIRYWDGLQWTASTAAAAPQMAPPANFNTPSAVASSPPPMTRSTPPPYVPGSAVAPGIRGATAKKKWLLGGAIAAGVIVVGSVGAALGSSNRADTAAPVLREAATSTPAAAASPTPTETPEESASATEAAPVDEAADPVAFKAQAGSHLDDMLKDLDDIVTTVNEDGFWRLLSNSGELAFNHAQLEGLDVPGNLVNTWPASLSTLQASLDSLTEAIGTQDGPSIISAVEAARAQVEATRDVVGAAQ